MSSTTPNLYRPNIAVFVLNEHGELLLCERSDIQGAWQVPQGGIDDGESITEAMSRELHEEIGVENVEVIAQYPGSIRYEWPEELYVRGYRGQEQHYSFVRIRKATTLTFSNHKQEFIDAQWVNKSEFLKRISGFKKNAYTEALCWFDRTFPGLLKE